MSCYTTIDEYGYPVSEYDVTQEESSGAVEKIKNAKSIDEIADIIASEIVNNIIEKINAKDIDKTENPPANLDNACGE